MSRSLVLLALGACGRVAFDPTTSVPASAYATEVLADGPVGYWRLGHPTRIVDEVGGPDGVIDGACQLLATGLLVDDPDGGIEFDGTSCFLELGPGFAFPDHAPFSIEAWISSRGSGFEHIVTRQLRGPSDPIDGYSLLDSPIGVYFERVTSAGTASITAKSVVTVARVSHYVGVFDGATLQLYRDGAPLGVASSNPNVVPVHAALLLVGVAQRGTGGYQSFFDGTIDEVAVYDRALPPARILLHYQIGSTGPD